MPTRITARPLVRICALIALLVIAITGVMAFRARKRAIGTAEPGRTACIIHLDAHSR